MQMLYDRSDPDKPVFNFDRATENFGHRFDHKSKSHLKRGIFEEETIIVPININDNHWVAAVIDMKGKQIQFYDSLGGTGKSLLQVIYRYLALEWERRKLPGTFDADKKWELLEKSPEKYPEQKNGYDCGVYVCCLYDMLIPNPEASPASEEECFFRRNFVAGRLIRHCTTQKHPAQIAEERDIERCRLVRLKRTSNRGSSLDGDTSSLEEPPSSLEEDTRPGNPASVTGEGGATNEDDASVSSKNRDEEASATDTNDVATGAQKQCTTLGRLRGMSRDADADASGSEGEYYAPEFGLTLRNTRQVSWRQLLDASIFPCSIFDIFMVYCHVVSHLALSSKCI